MNKIIAILISVLLTAIPHSGAASPAVVPPAQAAAAGVRNLGFDEEFEAPLDIG
jgi:hypothetical protein